MAISNGMHKIKLCPPISSFLTTTHFTCLCNQSNSSQHFNPPVNHPLQVQLTVNHHSSQFVFETEPPWLAFLQVHQNPPPSCACFSVPQPACPPFPTGPLNRYTLPSTDPFYN